METLFLTHCEPGMHQHPFPVLDDESEVVGGPLFKTVRRDGRLCFMHTPGGRFDLAKVLAATPDCAPELLLVHADSTAQCLPGNTRSLKVPRVLLVGDTHHQEAPLRTLIAYAMEERFDHVVLWNRHHAHYFVEAGVRSVHWLPGLLFSVPAFSGAAARKPQVGFFGSVGRYHPRRTLLLARLQAEGIALEAGPRPRREGLRMLSASAIGLNQSLNGEFNMRVLETLEAGALLMTDRLRPETGLEDILSSGRDYLDYSSPEEAVERARWALAHPAEANEIALRGQARGRALFSREARRSQLVDILTFADRDGPFSLASEPRCARPTVKPHQAVEFQERIMAYEFVQELHRMQRAVLVFGRAAAHPELAADWGDLSRLQWVEPAGGVGADVQGERVGVGRMDDAALEACADHFRYSPNDTAAGLVWGWRRISPAIGLYERLEDSCAEESFTGGWRQCWPGARTALVTLTIGEGFRARFTRWHLPSWKRYARRHRIDLVVLHEPLDGSARAGARSPAWQKCLVGGHPALAAYDQVAWIDADIVVTENAPNVFAGVAEDEIGAVDMKAIDTAFPETTARSAKYLAESGIPILQSPTSAEFYVRWGLPVGELGASADAVVQTGLFVFSPRRHSALLTEVYQRYEDKGAANWNYEMWPLSFEMVKRARIHWLDWRFNATTCDLFVLVDGRYRELFARLRAAAAENRPQRLKEVHTLFETALQRCFFLHLAGMGNYAELLPPSAL